MADDLLKLKWNRHDSTFFDVLKLQRDKPTYSDVVIAVEGQFFKVHKIVLGTCSDYFREIFETTSCTCPVIVLQDTTVQVMEYILDYMYIGEVDIRQIDLPYMLRAASTLRIKGLGSSKDEFYANPILANNLREDHPSREEPIQQSKKSSGKRPLSPSTTPSPTNKKKKTTSENQIVFPPVKVEANSDTSLGDCNETPDMNTEMITDNKSIDERNNYNDSVAENHVDEDYEEIETNGNGDLPMLTSLSSNLFSSSARDSVQCQLCTVTLANQNLLRRHVEDHHFHIRKYYCSHCGKKFKRKEHKERHERIHTGEKPFVCSICPSRFTQKEHLKGHVENVHLKHCKSANLEPKTVDTKESESTPPVLASPGTVALWGNSLPHNIPGTVFVPTVPNGASLESRSDEVPSAIYTPTNSNSKTSSNNHVQTVTFKYERK